ASIVIFHGYLKIITEGGTGWSPDLPNAAQVAIAWAELIGGVAVGLGLFSRLFALVFAVIMLGAILTVTGQRDFVYLSYYAVEIKGYRWSRVGYEYNFAIIVMSLALLILGSGHWSLDYCIFHAWRKRR